MRVEDERGQASESVRGDDRCIGKLDEGVEVFPAGHTLEAGRRPVCLDADAKRAAVAGGAL